VRKDIDIFGKTGTPVPSATDGIALFAGETAKDGKVVLVLVHGPRWRLHCFVHLNSIRTGALSFVVSGETIGTLAANGNAQGKPPHLRHSIGRILPAPWKVDGATQGHKKRFFLSILTLIYSNGDCRGQTLTSIHPSALLAHSASNRHGQGE